jgi:hypothetical protein
MKKRRLNSPWRKLTPEKKLAKPEKSMRKPRDNSLRLRKPRRLPRLRRLPLRIKSLLDRPVLLLLKLVKLRLLQELKPQTNWLLSMKLP